VAGKGKVVVGKPINSHDGLIYSVKRFLVLSSTHTLESIGKGSSTLTII